MKRPMLFGFYENRLSCNFCVYPRGFLVFGETPRITKLTGLCGWEPHGSVEESREVIRDVFSAPEVCAILSRESGALLGAVGLQPSSEIFPELSATEQREMGYWLGRPYWGHGVMTEAATELLRFGFEMLGLEAVWCSHYDWNSRSRRVIEKCGFRYQFTKETTNVIGMTNKTVFYALKKEEWLAFSGEKEFA